MTTEQEIAYVNSQVACALIEMQGMVAANVQARIENKNSPCNQQPLPFQKKDFDALIIQYGIHHNAVVTTLAGQ